MVVTQHGKAIRSTWPRVRIEYKNDKIGYLVDARGNGWKGQDRFYFGEKAKALKKAQEIARLYRELGADAAKFKFDDYTSYCGWQLLLKQAQEKHRLPYLTVEKVFQGFESYQEIWFRKKTNVPDLPSAANQWFEDKTAELGGEGGRTLSLASKKEHKQTVKYLKETFGQRSVDAVTHEMVEKYLKKAKRVDGKPLSQQTRKSRLTQFNMFFNWCMNPKRNWVKRNPCDGLSFHVEPKEVQILENEEVERLLNAAMLDADRNTILPWLVLGFFAGFRPSEASRLNWDEIDWDAKLDNGALQIRIGTEKSKTRTHFAELHPSGIEWLSRCHKDRSKIGFSQTTFKRIRKKIGLYDGWCPDCIRHSYASNWLAAHKSRGINTLAELMGNSPAIIGRYYRQARPAGKAEAYWKILPPSTLLKTNQLAG